MLICTKNNQIINDITVVAHTYHVFRGCERILCQIIMLIMFGNKADNTRKPFKIIQIWKWLIWMENTSCRRPIDNFTHLHNKFRCRFKKLTTLSQSIPLLCHKLNEIVDPESSKLLVCFQLNLCLLAGVNWLTIFNDQEVARVIILENSENLQNLYLDYP